MSIEQPSARARIRELVRAMPDTSTFDEILRELAFLRMVDRGLADADRKRTMSTEKLRERIRAWAR
ncbi:MAG: hypothetical protein GY719_43095 [bacterium]|nr:hypothetical protein [bacterium]